MKPPCNELPQREIMNTGNPTYPHPEKVFPSFPIPCDGETVYSLFGRYLTRSPEVESHILKAVTGKRLRTPLLSAIPGYTRNIAALMPKAHPWQKATVLVNKHTAFQYFTYFDSPSEHEQLLKELTNSNTSQAISMKLGLTSYKCGARPNHPQYCPHCVKEEIVSKGFSYFHREHQLPGVIFCWKHKIPLAEGCLYCGPYPIKGVPIMPGKCHCKEGISPLIITSAIVKNTEPLIWIAEQSAIMVDSESRCHGHIRATLRRIILEKGLGRGSTLNYKRLSHAIEIRFGKDTLQWLNFPAWQNDRPAAWVRKLLYPQQDGQKRSPAILFLLIIGTLFDSVLDFERTTTNQVAQSTLLNSCKKIPHTGLDHSLKLKYPVWTNDFFIALRKYDCGLPGTSKRLNVPVHELIREVRNHGWRIPLSEQTRKKLGDKKVDAIKNDLRHGLPKTEIMNSHNCSEWALTLIELDEEGLYLTHKNVSRQNTRNKNRQRVLATLKTKPSSSRSDIMKKLPGTYDFMIKHDQEWFSKQIPKKRRTELSPKQRKKDWSVIDEEKAKKISGAFELILNLNTKPIRATTRAALKKIDFLSSYNNSPEHFPKTFEIIQEKAETRPEFIRRRIKWSLQQIVKSQAQISLNKLSRTASLPPEVIKHYRDFIEAEVHRILNKTNGNSFSAQRRIHIFHQRY